MNDVAAIVLAGGRSSRMGTPKAALEWHGSTLLRRAVGIVGRAVGGPVVVVRAPGQDLPALPEAAEIVEDAREGQGPLMGIAGGLAALDGRATSAFVAGTDAPLLHPAFVRHVVRALDDSHDIALPEARGHRHPLAAAYRTALAPVVAELVAADRLRPGFLFERCRVRELDEAALLADPEVAACDPQLDSLLNLNEPADYEAARARPAPEVEVDGHGTVRGATLAGAAGAAGIDLGAYATVVIDGVHVAADPQLPLAAGDRLGFRPALP